MLQSQIWPAGPNTINKCNVQEANCFPNILESYLVQQEVKKSKQTERTRGKEQDYCRKNGCKAQFCVELTSFVLVVLNR